MCLSGTSSPSILRPVGRECCLCERTSWETQAYIAASLGLCLSWLCSGVSLTESSHCGCGPAPMETSNCIGVGRRPFVGQARLLSKEAPSNRTAWVQLVLKALAARWQLQAFQLRKRHSPKSSAVGLDARRRTAFASPALVQTWQSLGSVKGLSRCVGRRLIR